MTAAELFPGPVLSVQQPWAWAILHGGKDVENRTWQTSHRGRIWIHASQREDRESVEVVVARVAHGWGGRKHRARALAAYCERVSLGCIVGSVELVDVVPVSETVDGAEGLWAEGPWCWEDVAAEGDRQTDIKAQMKARLTELEARKAQLAITISRGEEYRDVQVRDTPDYAAGTVHTVRMDTGESIRTRRLSEEERQQDML